MEKNFVSYMFYLYKIKVDDMDSSCSMHKADKKVDNTEFVTKRKVRNRSF